MLGACHILVGAFVEGSYFLVGIFVGEESYVVLLVGQEIFVGWV